MALLLTDDELTDLVSLSAAIRAVREVFRERAGGLVHSATRSQLPLGGGRLVLTPGSLGRARRAGLRLYAAGCAQDHQLTAVWSADGSLDGLVLGSSLGLLRTGAIGAVALQLLAPERVDKVAVLGPGQQALQQVRALLAVRKPEWIELHRRDQSALPAQAEAWRREFGVRVTPAVNAETAVRGADVVIVATTSSTPVLKPEWLGAATHVSSLGPKRKDAHELALGVAEWANLVVSDFPEQCQSEPEFFLQGTPHLERLLDLSAFVSGRMRRDPSDRSLFVSHGLAGTEVAVASLALDLARQSERGVPLPGFPEL
ncbi:MAG: ornithine cyclodeaminase family protein [Planctomycetes bacterium]|nr:ornithine cyclodeaminase family protein [Planctomycetota bacterium]